MRRQITLIAFGLCFNPTHLKAEIIVTKDTVAFLERSKEDNPQSKRDGAIPRFLSFKKKKNALSYEKSCLGLPYRLDETKVRSYSSLNNFIEVCQKTDFEVSKNKEYVVVYSSSCQRPCNTAEIDWTCKLHATILNKNGYCLGDIEGNFKRVALHHTLPYVFLMKCSAGGEKTYAEVYDLRGVFIKTISDFQDVLLDKPLDAAR
jgi:hypothetical protein